MLGALRERQVKLKEDALVLQEQMTEFRNNIVKEVKHRINKKLTCTCTMQILKADSSVFKIFSLFVLIASPPHSTLSLLKNINKQVNRGLF